MLIRDDATQRAVSTTVDYHTGRGARPEPRERTDPAERDQRLAYHRALGDFVLGEVLGQGGFGTVYRAEQRSLGRAAVVKVVHRSLSRHDEVVERFTLEAQLAARFDHPYAAHVYAFGVEPDGVMWIAMELVKGTPLGELLGRGGPLELERFVPLFERLCEVVQSAHDQGIVHRDIKPSNIMVASHAGRLLPKLLDFGIAKLRCGRVAAPGDTTQAGDEPPTLTRDGQLLGTPVYMAPEQWSDAAAAGPAADQYALALLAFEALTGTPPFPGPSVELFAEQHRTAPLPDLPAHVPPGVHAVLARASHKDPAERYPTITELAHELRAAALGRRDEATEPTAVLPLELALQWTTEAPRPIAETIAALGTQRDARPQVAIIATLLARWIGAIAIACRSQLGPITDRDSRAAALLVALRRRPLLDEEWLELATALCVPYAERPELWPVPEMVRWLASDAARDRLRTVFRDRCELAPVLVDLAWLRAYTVAAGGEPLRGIHAARPRGGDLVMLDADGAPIVRLSPLIQAATAVPGEPADVFVLCGPGRRDETARFTSQPRGFERDDDALWSWLAENVLDAGIATGGSVTEDRSPYPGLAAYTAADHESFVGRERDVEELTNRLRTHPLVTLVGPSGVGKTSFLAAGVVPALGPEWEVVILRPGSDPVTTLAAAVDQCGGRPYRAGRGAGALLLVVDQAEELFTACGDEARRARFAEALVELTTSGQVRAVIAMRDDFLCRIEELPALRGVLGRSVHVLRPPSRADLERILTVPAQRRGVDFADPALAGEIVREVVGRPGALPLLAFAAAELWEHRDRHFRRLTRGAYERIGGVTGALVQHADGVVDRMPAADRRLVRLAFRRLLSREGTRLSIARTELVAALGDHGTRVIDRLLAARLVVSRDEEDGDRIEVIHETLATEWPRLAGWRSEDADGARVQAELAAAARTWHERGRPGDLLWRGAALADLVRWQANAGTGATALEVDFVQASLHAASRARRRKLTVVGAASILTTAGIIGLISANQAIGDQRTAALGRLAASYEERARLAILDGDNARGMLYLAEAGRLGAHGAGFDVLATQAGAALTRGVETVGKLDVGIRDFAVAGDMRAVVGADLTVWAWDGSIPHRLGSDARAVTVAGDRVLFLSGTALLAADPTGRVRWRAADAIADPRVRHALSAVPAVHLALTTGPGARLWDTETGTLRGELPHDREVTAGTLSPSGSRVATGDVAGVVRVWDATTRALLATCEPHHDEVRVVVFSPDERTVASGAGDADVRICDTTTGATRRRLVGHSKALLGVAYSPDGRALASNGRDGKPRIWNVETGELLGVLEGHDGLVIAAGWAPDGKRLATVGVDGTARIWSREGIALATLQGNGGPISAPGAWEPDGHHYLTAAYDGRVRRWDVDRMVTGVHVEAHDDVIEDLAISHDERWLATASDDKRATLHDRVTGRVLAELPHAQQVLSAAFDARDTRLVTADTGGNARVWATPSGALQATLPGDAATFAPDGSVITASGGQVRFWTADGRPGPTVACPYTADRLVLDPSGRWLFVRGRTGSVLVVDVRTHEAVTHLSLHGQRAAEIAANTTRVAITDGTTIRLWALGTWIPSGELVGHKALVMGLWFLPDGRLASAAFDGAFVWDGDRLVAKLSTVSQVYGLAAAPDGSILSTTGADGSVRIWDATSYRELVRLPGHRRGTNAIQLARDGETVITGGGDGVLSIARVARRTHSAAELAEIVRCRVPLRLEGDAVLPRDLDLDDQSCAR